MVDDAFHHIGIHVRILTSEFHAQILGRRALHEIRFARYRAANGLEEREVQELAYRRLASTQLGRKLRS